VNTNELEDVIRAELRAEVRQSPAGAPTKAAVLQAVAGLPMDPEVRRLRHWTVPLLAAAAVVLVAVGLTVGARALTSSRPHHPNQPINQQRITPPPPIGEDCSANDQTLVNGAQTSYLVSATGERRYIFEYYCAGADGARSASLLQVFRRVGATLQPQSEVPRDQDTIVLSLTGGRDGFRAIQAVGFTLGATPPDVVEADYRAPFYDPPSVGTEVAPGCRQADLAVRLDSAQLPSPHQILHLTNHSAHSCAVWGNPHYTPLTATGLVGSQPVSYLLRGPAGGVNTAQAAPVLILQPGQAAAASIGTSESPGCLPSVKLRIVLQPDIDLGLHARTDLGTQPFSACGIIGYPLVSKASGDDVGDYPTTTPQPAGPISCLDDNQLLLSAHQASTQSGDGSGRVFTIKLLAGQPCTLSGYPTMRAVDSVGKAVQVASDTPRGVLGGLAAGTTSPPRITLTKGQSVSTTVEWAAAAYTPTSQCVRNVRISLTFGATSSIPNPSIGQVCDLTVHPWVAGTTGSQ
jgi:hypothetical protein